MPNKLEDIELRSEEVQEILTTVPHWMLRWGNVLFLILILMLFFLSWLIKHPDIITSQALITTQIPPQKEYAKITGNLDVILVNDNEQVAKNQVLAVLENTANYNDIFKLKTIVDTIQLNNKSFAFPIDKMPVLFLGEIETQYLLFENSYIQYQLNKKLSKGTEITKVKEEMVLLKNVIQSFNLLKKAIKDWEYQYVLKSNIEGQVSFLNIWDKNQTVKQGDLVFTIIPNKNASFIAKLKTPAQNFGKIKVGQKVNIKLENYPDTEFGVIKGKIKNISLSQNEAGLYTIDAELPKKLITSYNKTINFKQEMQGTAEIITEDLRLIERFFYQFKAVLRR